MTSLRASGVGIPGRLSPSDLLVQSGELVALVGPNGGGKTSLLRALARIEASSGVVEVAGENLDQASLARRRRLLSFMPASRDLVWPIAVHDVIALGLDRPDPERVAELIDLLELDQLAIRPVNSLSTGERARVLVARALAARPAVLLLDEPLSNLDPYWALRLLDILEATARDGQIVIAALHDLQQLARFDRALVVSDGSLALDDAPGAMMKSAIFSRIFRIRPKGSGWELRPREGQRSSP